MRWDIGLNVRIGVFALLAAAFFAGCLDLVSTPQGASPDVPATGAYTLVVGIAGESPAQARTALPGVPESEKYTISVGGKGSANVPKGGGGPYSIQLTAAPEVGDIVTVDSYDGSNTKNASGSHTLTAANLSGTDITVTLHPLLAGSGNVDLKVNFDPGSGDTEITKAELSLYTNLAAYKEGSTAKTALYGKAGGGSGADWTDFAGDNPETIPIKYDALPSGNYVVKIDFYRGSKLVSRLLQAVNVRGGLTTNTWVEGNGGDTLEWNVFGSSNVNLAESNAVQIDGNTAIYDDTTHTYNLYMSTIEAPDDMTLKVTAGEAGQFITAKLGKGDSSVTLTSGVDHTFTTGLSLTNSLEITVTAPDGITSQIYYVNITGKEIIAFYFEIGEKKYGVGTGVETGSGSMDGTTITVNVPYGTNLTTSYPAITCSGDTFSVLHSEGSSSKYDPWGSAPSPHTYRVAAADGTTKDYSVTVNVAEGIAIEGITTAGLSRLWLEGLPSGPVAPGETFTITINDSNVTVTAWYIDISGRESATHTTSSFTVPATATPGFYNVNIFATVDGVEYSGSVGLVVVKKAGE
jgi:hypothetical protein